MPRQQKKYQLEVILHYHVFGKILSGVPSSDKNCQMLLNLVEAQASLVKSTTKKQNLKLVRRTLFTKQGKRIHNMAPVGSQTVLL